MDDVPFLARSNRAYLGRPVRWCIARGVVQFLDLGSGVPTVGNMHELALAATPEARVAYVDFEPVAVARGAEIVADLDTVTATRADLRDPDSVLAAPGVASLLDFSRPVALLAVSCLHFVGDEVYPVMDRYREWLVPGSVIGVSHVSDDIPDPAVAERMRAMTEASRAGPTSEASSPEASPLPACTQERSEPLRAPERGVPRDEWSPSSGGRVLPTSR